MTDPQARIDAIYRYPVKGLSPQPLARTTLSPGATLPADRLYAIENGPSGFDPAQPKYFPKQRFLMLMRNERLAAHLPIRVEALYRALRPAEKPGGDAPPSADPPEGSAD